MAASQLAGTSSKQLFTPEGWAYQGSLSQTFGFVPTGEEQKSLELLRSEGGLEVYRNKLTGGELFVARMAEHY